MYKKLLHSWDPATHDVLPVVKKELARLSSVTGVRGSKLGYKFYEVDPESPLMIV